MSVSAEKYLESKNNVDPTRQETLLLKLGSGAFCAAVEHIAADLNNGHSPSVLSIARPDLLIGFAKTWRTFMNDFEATSSSKPTYKTAYFDSLLDQATSEGPAGIEALPKFVTSLGQLGIVAALVLDHQEAIRKQHEQRKYIQYLGTFDPQHIGHRIAIKSSLVAEGEDSSVIVHVMGQHPRKKRFSQSYYERYDNSEERLYKSSLLDNTRITQVDVPGGIGLAAQYPGQMQLIADISGDTEHRWLTGSDKLLLDATAVKTGSAAQKAIDRFSDPKMHAYIVHRLSDDRQTLENNIDYISERFNTKITLVEELPYDCAPASSSRIKQLHNEGRHSEANHMELYELEQ